jgi:hypothetical protein
MVDDATLPADPQWKVNESCNLLLSNIKVPKSASTTTSHFPVPKPEVSLPQHSLPPHTSIVLEFPDNC